MPPLLPVLTIDAEQLKLHVIIGMFAVVGVVFAVHAHLEKRRREALSRMALRLGFSFTPNSRETPGEAYGTLPLFTRGHSRGARNVVEGVASGHHTRIFDYQYTVGSGKHSSTHRQTVVAFHLAGNSLPEFSMEPEHVFHKIGEAFGYKDIDFAHHPEFSKGYFLRGKDEQAIRTLFQPSLLTLFNRQKGWNVEGGGDRLIVYQWSKRAKPEETGRFLEEAIRIAGLFVTRSFHA
jgi:hypothetical protein